jgi:LmbE family N-acetylglucosaminyl deacetylase
MLAFMPELTAGATVLCLGAHCDDIELGCSGALIELRQRFPALRFVWVVFAGDETREAETRAAAARLLGNDERCSVSVHRFRASYFPSCAAEVKDAMEALRSRIEPQLIFTHHLADRHQDHRLVGELTWNSFRNHSILEYEIAKFEGDLGQPNCYVPLSAPVLERKVATLMDCFPSQHARGWFDAELFRGHMRLRGMECNAHSRYAEAFHVRKFRL